MSVDFYQDNKDKYIHTCQTFYTKFSIIMNLLQRGYMKVEYIWFNMIHTITWIRIYQDAFNLSINECKNIEYRNVIFVEYTVQLKSNV